MWQTGKTLCRHTARLDPLCKIALFVSDVWLYLITLYPVALRAISATVPTAFFVLACEGLKENKPTKRQKLPKTGIKKLPKIIKKLTPGGGPGGSWGRSWDYFGPGGDPGCPRDARSRKSDEKFVFSPFVPQLLGTPKSDIFDIFQFFGVFLGGCFSEAVSGGLWAPFWRILGWFPN